MKSLVKTRWSKFTKFDLVSHLANLESLFHYMAEQYQKDYDKYRKEEKYDASGRAHATASTYEHVLDVVQRINETPEERAKRLGLERK